MANEHLTSSPAGEFVMFASGDGRVRVECRFGVGHNLVISSING
ncbi:DNA-binding protein [Klebsiella oxytoca]|nr:DNA-binding protein [Klebsiella oxytoca]